jgi:hypothetical protein
MSCSLVLRSQWSSHTSQSRIWVVEIQFIFSWSHIRVVEYSFSSHYSQLLKSCFSRRTRERLLYDVHRYTHTDNSSTTTVRRAHTRTTREWLLYDYCTTCTDIDIDRYRQTHIHTYTHISTHIHTNTHTHIHTAHTHTTQEVANYIAAEVHRAARSGDLRCNRSASCHKQWQTTFIRIQGHGKQRK